MIDKNDRKRLKFITRRLDEKISEQEGDYYITNFRGEIDNYIKIKTQKFYPYNNEVFSIRKNNMKILGVYKLQKQRQVQTYINKVTHQLKYQV